MRIDLNDYAYFAEVVAHGGFAAAGRALREPKSKLSRRIAALEARLGRAADRAVEPALPRHRGRAELLRALPGDDAGGGAGRGAGRGGAGRAARAHPHELPDRPDRGRCPRWCAVSWPATRRCRLQLVATDRPVDLIEERIDVALRVRRDLTSDASLTMRSLGLSHVDPGRQPADRQPPRRPTSPTLGTVPTLGTSDDPGEVDMAARARGRGDIHAAPRAAPDLRRLRHPLRRGRRRARGRVPARPCLRGALAAGRLVPSTRTGAASPASSTSSSRPGADCRRPSAR